METINDGYAEKIAQSARRLLAEKKKQQRLREKNTDGMTPKARSNHDANLAYQNKDVANCIFDLHTEIVKAGVCKPCEDEWYKDVTFEPSAFHRYTLKRPHPLKELK